MITHLYEYSFSKGYRDETFSFNVTFVPVKECPKIFIRTDNGSFGPDRHTRLSKGNLGTPLTITWVAIKGGTISAYFLYDSSENRKVFKQGCLRIAEQWIDKVECEVVSAKTYKDILQKIIVTDI